MRVVVRIFTALALAAASLLGGCAARQAPVFVGEGPILSVTAHQPPPRIAVPACGGEDSIVTNDGVEIDLECEDRHRNCRGELPVAFRNCSAEIALVSRLVLRSDWDRTSMMVELDPLPVVRPGESWSHRVTVSWPRGFEIEIETLALDGEPRSVTMRASVRNPHREEEMARCRECDGDWGRHGLLGLEGCNCRARDAGEECRDGRDCEGTCLYERSERVQEASESCGPDGMCHVTLELFVLVGRCSEFVATFGCHHYLPDGISERGPFMSSYPAPYRCSD